MKNIEEQPLRHNLKLRFNEISVNYWDYKDKKCPYHRKETSQVTKLASRVFNKHLGKSYKELLDIFKSKKLRHLEYKIVTQWLNEILQGSDESFLFNTEDKLELRQKVITTKSEYNPYRYRRFILDDLLNSDNRFDQSLFEKFEKFINMLERNGYSVEVSGSSFNFSGKGIKGYSTINPNYSNYSGLVFVNYSEFFDKISRCPLVFDLPKSLLGFKSALKEIEYLGTNSAKKDLIQDIYKPKHVNFIQWWNR